MREKSVLHWSYSSSVYTVKSILEGSGSDAVDCEAGPVLKYVTVSLVKLSYLRHHSEILCLNMKVHILIQLKEIHCMYL